MKRTFRVSVWQEERWFVAQYLEVAIASQGATENAALDNLAEAVALHFSPPQADLLPDLRTIEVEISAA